MYNKIIIVNLIMTCSFVLFISGVIVFIFSIKEYDDWINISVITKRYSIYLGLVLAFTGFLFFRYCLMILSRFNSKKNQKNK